MLKNKLKELRVSSKMTQKELSEKLFVSRTTIASWEQGKNIPKTEKLQQIADLFKVDMDYFKEYNSMRRNIFKHKSMLYISFLLVMIIFASIFFYSHKNTEDKFLYHQFFSEKTLDKYDLMNLKSINNNTRQTLLKNDEFYDDIKNKETYQKYVEYFFKFLKNNPAISQIGFSIKLVNQKQYVVPSDRLSDYRKEGGYRFYYLSKRNEDQKHEGQREFKSVYLSHGDFQINVEDKVVFKNFTFQISKIDLLFYTDYYSLNSIGIDKENFYQYFSIAVLENSYGYDYSIRFNRSIYFAGCIQISIEVKNDYSSDSKSLVIDNSFWFSSRSIHFYSADYIFVDGEITYIFDMTVYGYIYY